MTIQTEEKVGAVDRFFEITKRGSTFLRETNGGVATFLAMSYIVVLNPIILTGAPVEGYTPSFHSVATVTALVAAIATLAMGVIGKVPFALAAGLGINGIVAFQLAPILGYEGAMAVVVLEGMITFLLVITGIRVALFNAIPLVLKQAIGAGIGAFLILIGFVDGGVVKGAPLAPSLNLEPLNTWPRLVFVLVLIATIVMVIKKWKGAIIIAIVGGTTLAVIIETFAKLGSAVDNPAGWVLNVPSLAGKEVVTGPDWSVFGHFSFVNAFSAGPILLVFFVFSLILADLFDTSGTIVAVSKGADLLDEKGNPARLGRILGVDSLAAALGGFAGVSSNTTYIESATGVRAGARTGFANVITAVLFLVAILLTPLVQLVPSEAAAPVLVVVGSLMVWEFVGVAVKEHADELALASVLGILVMPFTYSITNGIGVAFIVYTVSMVANKKARLLHPLMWVMAVAFIVYFALPLIRMWLGI
ncbi:MAG: NCS2 family permease [Candidatus Saccharimonadales bacterium]